MGGSYEERSRFHTDGKGASSYGDEVSREGLAAAHDAEQNRLLQALPMEDYSAVFPHLVPVRLAFTDVVVEAATPIQHVYFIREGVASVLAEQQEGGSVEVGTIGPEGFIGIPVLLGATSMPYRVVIQVEGEGYRLDSALFREIVEERKAVRDLLLRFAHYWTSQLSQSVACNRLHTLDERCARWLLMTHDRVERGTFELTHEFMSLMLGVRRAGVSVAMRQLLEQKIIAYTRGRVRVLDRGRLEEASCRCYQITRAQYQEVLGLGEAG
jgi:CRP-like cAMP-binding protein